MGNLAMVMVAIMMVAGMTRLVEGQGGSTPSCANALVPCANYLNSTKPPASCCTPLSQAVKTQLKCLCNLLNDPSLFQSFQINRTQALELPMHCGLNDTTAACSKFASSPSPTPSQTSLTTPPPPPGSTSSGVGKLAWNGMSYLLVLLASMVVIMDLCVLQIRA